MSTLQDLSTDLSRHLRASAHFLAWLLVAATAVALACLVPTEAHAQGIQVPFVSGFGCSIVKWLRGPLSILVFILVVVVTLVIGMISKMDWGRLIAVVIIFGVIISLPSILTSSSYASQLSGMSSCLD